jgi:hypothetical protein
MKNTNKNPNSGKAGKDESKNKGTFPKQDQSAKKSGDMVKENSKHKR